MRIKSRNVINALTGLTVLAVPGVNTLTQLEVALTELRSEGLVEIKTDFDMDFASNHHVQNGYNSLLRLLGDMGFRYGTYLWDPATKVLMIISGSISFGDKNKNGA